MNSTNKKLKREIIEIDADGRSVGRVAAQIAMILQGKTKVTFARNIDSGDYVVVKNAAKIKFAGRKLEQKDYKRHTMHPGGLKVRAMKHVFEEDPAIVVRHAVYGMLPKNKLRENMIKRLLVKA